MWDTGIRPALCVLSLPSSDAVRRSIARSNRCCGNVADWAKQIRLTTGAKLLQWLNNRHQQVQAILIIRAVDFRQS